MKKIFSIALGSLLLSSGALAQSKIEARINHAENNTKVYLSKLSDSFKKIAIDSSVVENNSFSFTMPKVEQQTLQVLTIDGFGDLSFINDNNDLKVNIDLENIQNTSIKGSRANELLYKYRVYIMEKNEDLLAISGKYTRDELSNPEIRNEVAKQQTGIAEEIASYSLDLVRKNLDQLPSLFILMDLSESPAANDGEMVQVFRQLPSELRLTNVGQQLAKKYEQPEGVFLDDTAPNFSATNPQGKEISLQDVMKNGKYTLVQFWASWCSFCREEMPNVSEYYNKYHKDGLEIIGVSLDNELADWTDAIQTYNLKFENISTLLRWEDPIGAHYGIRSIPTNYLVDNKTGKVVAMQLKAEKLEEKIKELLNK